MATPWLGLAGNLGARAVTVEPFTLRVRHGVEFVDGRAVGLVYLVDRRDPLVEITYPLPVREALALAESISSAAFRLQDPVRATARVRDGHAVELTLSLAAAGHAVRTIRRHAEAAALLHGTRRHEVAA